MSVLLSFPLTRSHSAINTTFKNVYKCLCRSTWIGLSQRDIGITFFHQQCFGYRLPVAVHCGDGIVGPWTIQGVMRMLRYGLSLFLIALFCSCVRQPSEPSVTPLTQETPDDRQVGSVQYEEKCPKNGKQFLVGWVPMDNPQNEYWKLVDEGMRQTVERAGGRLLYRSPNFDPVKQNDRIRELIVEDVDCIVVFPLNVYSLSSAIELANDAGIPVGIFLNTIPEETNVEVLFTVTLGDLEAARRAGQAMIDALVAKHGEPVGKVLEVQGKMTTTGAKRRAAGFHEVVDQYPNVYVVSKSADWNTGKATRIIQDWMSAHPDTDGIYLHSDANYTPAAQAALSAIGRWAPKGQKEHVILTGEDGTNIAVHAIRYGYMEFTSDFGIADLAPLMGDLVMEYLISGAVPRVGDKIVRPKTLWKETFVETQPGMTGPIIPIPITTITRENADDQRLFANKYQGAPNGRSPLAW